MSEATATLDRTATTEDGVVLLHGISRTPRSFRKMQAAIETSGFATLNLGYASRQKALEALAEDIHPAIERFANGVGQSGWVAWSCSAPPIAAARSPTA
jgi:hypothetical protein